MAVCSFCELSDGDHRKQCPNRTPTKTNKVLYCICYEFKLRPGVWDCDKLYLHAENDGDARWQFLRAENPDLMREMRIVGIAPVVGYFVNDTRGEALSV